MAALNGGLIGDKKSATQILAALAWSQSGLTLSCPLPHEGTGRKLKPPLGMGLTQYADRLHGEAARLVEAALGLPCAMQRYGHDEQLRRSGWVDLRGHLRDGCREARAQFAGQRGDALKLERMDGAAQRAVVFAKADGADERGRSEAAGTANRLA